jgi:hypothetical protein
VRTTDMVSTQQSEDGMHMMRIATTHTHLDSHEQMTARTNVCGTDTHKYNYMLNPNNTTRNIERGRKPHASMRCHAYETNTIMSHRTLLPSNTATMGWNGCRITGCHWPLCERRK